jgi:hypothetical protein
MKEYIPPDPAWGEMVRKSDQESDEQRQRLENEPSDNLRAVMLDTNETEAARGNALGLLLMRTDPQTQQLLPPLFEDAKIGHLAIRYCHPDNQAGVKRLRSLLTSSNQRTRTMAAIALANAKDNSVKPVMLAWFSGQDQGDRNVAMQALTELDEPAALELFRQSWEAGDRKDSLEDRLCLAERMLNLGDNRGMKLLATVGREAKGAWSSFAGFTLLSHDPTLACEVLLHILDDGDEEAKQSVVSQVWNFERNPNAFNAEGLHEARQWIERQVGPACRAGPEPGAT